MECGFRGVSIVLRATTFVGLVVFAAATALAQASDSEPFDPQSGLIGRDVDWVPTPPVLLKKMLDMARLRPTDYVIDVGSGDGRNVIAAARRGASGHGIEYNPKLVALSRRNAEKAGLSARARFFEGDMFEADLSQADVMPLFLTDENLAQLSPQLRTLKPGARIVNNGFEIPGWDYDEIGIVEGGCGVWCTAYLYVVPARLEGRWQMDDGAVLTLHQEFQRVSGELSADGQSRSVAGRVTGDLVRLTVGTARYSGRICGDLLTGRIEDEAGGRASAARRQPQ